MEFSAYSFLLLPAVEISFSSFNTSLYENTVPPHHGGSAKVRDVFVGLLTPSVRGLGRSSGHHTGFLLDQAIGMEHGRSGVDTCRCDSCHLHPSGFPGGAWHEAPATRCLVDGTRLPPRRERCKTSLPWCRIQRYSEHPGCMTRSRNWEKTWWEFRLVRLVKAIKSQVQIVKVGYVHVLGASEILSFIWLVVYLLWVFISFPKVT